MSLSPWERQRDLLQLSRAAMEKDLAELRSFPAELLNEDHTRRVRNLIKLLETKIVTNDSLLVEAESKSKENKMTFDLSEGKRLKKIVMDMAAESHESLLNKARVVAHTLALRNGSVTSDDVYAEMELQKMHPSGLGNSAGSVFRTSFWHTGEYRHSTRVSNHGRMVRVWRLK